MRDNDAQGRFAIKIERHDGNVYAVLTGEHFEHCELGEAIALSADDGKASCVKGGSPVYLVRDSAVGLGAGSFGKYTSDVMSKCHDGPRGKPCGKCDECMAAKSAAFTMLMLPAIDLPEGDLSDRLKESVGDVIGMTWAGAPWNGCMTKEEVSRTFRKLGVKRTRAKKEKKK